MSVLAEILSSRVRAEVFRILFGGTVYELHHREIVRRSGLSEGAVRQELNKLSRLDLVKRREDGNRVYYTANRQHPLHQELRRIVLKTVGLVGVLQETLQESDVRIAFVFGSIARGEETAGSDIDLMVIGNVGLRKLSSSLSEVTEQLGREVNPHVMTEAEYRKRSKKGDHFVTHVLDGPKLFIVGAERDLEAMGEQRLAKS